MTKLSELDAMLTFGADDILAATEDASGNSKSVTGTVLKTYMNADTVMLTSTQTLTNKTLTSPKINENVAVVATSTEVDAVCVGASSGSGAAGGDLTGNVYWEKIGNIVFITWAALTHASSHYAVTAAELIPAGFRPATNHYDTVYVNQLGSLSVIVSTLGTFNFYYHDSAGATRNATQVLAGSTHYRAA